MNNALSLIAGLEAEHMYFAISCTIKVTLNEKFALKALTHLPTLSEDRMANVFRPCLRTVRKQHWVPFPVAYEKQDTLKRAVFWVVAPCSLVEACRRFKDSCFLRHKGDVVFASADVFLNISLDNLELSPKQALRM
jgi:hypothetical protein